MRSGKNFSSPSFNFDITETCSGTGKVRLAACSYDYIINETWLIERACLFNAQLGLVALFGPAQFPPRFPAQDLDQSAHMEQINQSTNHVSASQESVERLFWICGNILSQQRLRTNDRNFENVLFANVNYDVFDMESRKRKQPDGDNDNQWWSKDLSKYSTFAVMKSGNSRKSGLVLKKR